MDFKNVILVIVTFAVLYLHHNVGIVLSFELSSDSQEVFERSKRSMTTICVEIKPSSPQEKPYYMCKGSDLPTFPKGPNLNTRAEQLENHEPSYSSSYGEAPAQKTQFTENRGIMAYGTPPEQATQSKNLETQKLFPGFGGFRGVEGSSAGLQQQKFFPPTQTFQYGYEQQQPANVGRQDKQPTSTAQSAFGTRLPTFGPQNTYTEGTPFGTTTETQTAYEPQHNEARPGISSRIRPISGFRYGRPRSGANTGGNVLGEGPNTQLPTESINKGPTGPAANGGSYSQPTYAAPSHSIEHAPQSSYGQTVPFAHANAESATTGKLVNAQIAPSGVHVAPQSIPASRIVRPENGAVNTQSSSSRHRAMIDEDVFGPPNWGFSPDEFINARSMLNTWQSRSEDFPVQQQLRNVPADYMDDPVLRQFYAPLPDEPIVPAVETQPILATQARYEQTQPMRTLNTEKSCPVSTEPHSQSPHYTTRIASSQPDISRRPQFRNAAGPNAGAEYISDSATCCSQAPQATPLRNLPPCDPNFQRSYNFQPVFIALPCYEQQTAFRNTQQYAYPSYGDAHILLGSPAVVPNFALWSPTVASINPTAQFYQMSPVGFNADSMGPKVPTSNMAQQPAFDADPILGSSRILDSKNKTETTVKPATDEDFEEDAEEVKPEEEQSSVESKKNAETVSSKQETDTIDVDSDEIFDSPKTTTEIPKTTTIGKPVTNNIRGQQPLVAVTNKMAQKGDTPQMEEETQKSFESLMNLAKIAKNFNKEEFASTGPTVGKTHHRSQTTNGPSPKKLTEDEQPANKRKRQNLKAGTSGRTGAKRQYVQRI